MKRIDLKELLKWKDSKKRKPLILRGARQVGKTWLLKEFGKSYFKNVVYINFEKSERLKNLFLDDFDIPRIINFIEVESGVTIEAENTLIIFDEIQEAYKGLTSLKYFYEDAPQYYITAAGSLLGVAMQNQSSFPVGKVDFLYLYPMSFYEFLLSIDEVKLGELLIKNEWDLINAFHDKFIQYLRLYYFIGGMPEAVKEYVDSKNLNSVREIHYKIITGFENDFGKHSPKEITPRIRLIWNSVLSQLSKENKKFIYGKISKGARAKDFELAINWLVDAGLLYKVNLITKPSIPLNSYQNIDAFKLYLLDVGLMLALGNVSSKVILDKNKILTEFKGALTEQFICQELKFNGIKDLYYWSPENGKAEVDFITQTEMEVVPIEVKAEENLQSKSLKSYVDKYNPSLALKTSMNKFREESWMKNIPIFSLAHLIKSL